MKKILSIILGAFVCFQAFAQINVNGGYVNTAYQSSNDKLTGDGFYVGASTDIELSQILFAPGLNFSYVNYNVGSGVNANEYFLSAPLHFKYIYPVNKNVGVFVSAGPTLIYSLGGKTSISYGGFSYSKDAEKGKFDVTLGFEAGALISKNFKIACGYDFGLVNQSGDSDSRVTRNILHIGIGYCF